MHVRSIIPGTEGGKHLDGFRSRLSVGEPISRLATTIVGGASRRVMGIVGRRRETERKRDRWIDGSIDWERGRERERERERARDRHREAEAEAETDRQREREREREGERERRRGERQGESE